MPAEGYQDCQCLTRRTTRARFGCNSCRALGHHTGTGPSRQLDQLGSCSSGSGPRRLLHPRKKTVGVRIPDHVVTQALLAELGEPLVSSTLLLPDETEPPTRGWEIKERLDHVVDAVIDSGECGATPTTVVDFSQEEPEILRRGTGDTSLFE